MADLPKPRPLVGLTNKASFDRVVLDVANCRLELFRRPTPVIEVFVLPEVSLQPEDPIGLACSVAFQNTKMLAEQMIHSCTVAQQQMAVVGHHDSRMNFPASFLVKPFECTHHNSSDCSVPQVHRSGL